MTTLAPVHSMLKLMIQSVFINSEVINLGHGFEVSANKDMLKSGKPLEHNLQIYKLALTQYVIRSIILIEIIPGTGSISK